MLKQRTKIIDLNWFFVSLILFVIVLPFSQAFVSICAGLLLFTALVEDSWQNKIRRLHKNKILLFFPAVYLIYILSTLFFSNYNSALYDLNKTLLFLIIPFAFILGKKISDIQIRYIFYTFLFAIIVSTLIAIFKWNITANTINFSVHKISLISHIRFSFQLILAIWFLVFIIKNNFKKLKYSTILVAGFFILYFLAFLFFQQSLTGLVALFTSLFCFILIISFKITRNIRSVLFVLLFFIITIPAYYIYNVIHKFYDFETINEESIDKRTKQGNLYWHDFKNKGVENGNFVGLYTCDVELREEWNKRSEIEYDSIAKNGFAIQTTLKRYLTSKGLRKDAEGINKLNDKDIENIENCIANVIFAEKRYSLYPRIYQTVWEYYTYSTTGYSNNQSLSQRIEFAKAAVTIIKSNIWFGVGLGNWQEEFKNAYHKNKSTLSERFYASSHNQYLNYLVKFGLIGFVLIMFFIVFPVVKTRSYKNHFFLIFLIFMFFANFADSNFESHMGNSFFVFFYCLLLVYSKSDFLILNKTNIDKKV